jgi:hypothetical protein
LQDELAAAELARAKWEEANARLVERETRLREHDELIERSESIEAAESEAREVDAQRQRAEDAIVECDRLRARLATVADDIAKRDDVERELGRQRSNLEALERAEKPVVLRLRQAHTDVAVADGELRL